MSVHVVITLVVMKQIIQIVSLGWAWQNPGPPKCLLCADTYIAKRSRYSNRTVKYCIKAVNKPYQLTKFCYTTAII